MNELQELSEYRGKYFYCGVCGEKTACVDWEAIERRDRVVDKSQSIKSLTTISERYNKRNGLKESDYWKCVGQYCKLETDDANIWNVLVFKRLALLRQYTPKKTSYSKFW